MFTIPVLNIKANPLDALLAGVGYRLSMLADSGDESFAALLEDRNVTIQLGSQADGVSRYFTFDHGDITQYSGEADNPDLTIDFQDSMTGVKLLTGGNVAAFMSAVQDKELTMEGDYSLLMWFNQIAKHIVPPIPDEVKPLLQKAKPYIYKAQDLASQTVGIIRHKLNK